MSPELPNLLGKPFESLKRRILYSYVATYPPFIAVQGVGEASQRQMHAFLRDMLYTLYNDPHLIGGEDAPDDCYRGSQLNNSRPELISAMEKIEARFIAFVEPLIALAAAGEPVPGGFRVEKDARAISKQFADKLAAIGLTVARDKQGATITSERYPDLHEAWAAYGARDDTGAQKVTRVLTFIHTRYMGRVYRCGDFFGGLLGDPALFESMEAYFERHGFELSNFDLNNKTRFAYVKWQKEYPGKEVGSLRVYYTWRKEQQLFIEFRLPGFRQLLNGDRGYDSWDDELKAMVYARLKTCDGCGYCTQTDKTGKRPRLCVTRTCGGETALKCPLFPWFSWNEITERDVSFMTRLFSLCEA